MRELPRPVKPLRWVASSRKDYQQFPPKVQDTFGFELFLAQTGEHPPSAKPLKGFGGGVVELIENFDGDTYRAIYAVRFETTVYVLHCFKEIEARQEDPAKRPGAGEEAAQGRGSGLQRRETRKETTMSRTGTRIYESDANIFADLGLPDADTHYLKAQIVAELFRLTRQRKLTQAKAGERMGISQPEVSRLFKGHFREYSVERLMEFLTTFDRDVEIVSRPGARKGERGHITFKAANA